MARRPGFLGRLGCDEDGATMAEYVLMIGFVALACIVGVTALGSSLAGPFQQAITGLS